MRFLQVKMGRWGGFIGGCVILTLALVASCGAQSIQSGQKMAFLGDSITQAGWDDHWGYVRLVVRGLSANGIEITPIPAGVGGNKSNDMLRRLQSDVLDKHPDWMSVSCGVNDVWHGASGIPLEQFKTNMTQLVRQAKAANVRVVILTATMIQEDPTTANNQKLAAYNAFLRQLAKDENCPLGDLNALMQQQVAQLKAAGYQPGHLLTNDGVHMNPRGDLMMAEGLLRALDVNDEQMAKAREAWLDDPRGWTAEVTYTLKVQQPMSLRSYLQLAEQAPKDNPDVRDMLQKQLEQMIPADWVKSITDQFHKAMSQRR